MKEGATKCATDKEAAQEAEKAKFLKEIRLLTQVLHAPKNLIGLFKVVEEFQQILTLTPIAGEGSRTMLRRLEAIIESIQTNHPSILELFPEANQKSRKTLTDYYQTNLSLRNLLEPSERICICPTTARRCSFSASGTNQTRSGTHEGA